MKKTLTIILICLITFTNVPTFNVSNISDKRKIYHNADLV